MVTREGSCLPWEVSPTSTQEGATMDWIELFFGGGWLEHRCSPKCGDNSYVWELKTAKVMYAGLVLPEETTENRLCPWTKSSLSTQQGSRRPEDATWILTNPASRTARSQFLWCVPQQSEEFCHSSPGWLTQGHTSRLFHILIWKAAVSASEVSERGWKGSGHDALRYVTLAYCFKAEATEKQQV